MSAFAPRFVSVEDYANERSRLTEDVFFARFPASVIIARAGSGVEPSSDWLEPTKPRLDRHSFVPRTSSVPIDGRSVVYAITKSPTRPFPERVGVGRARGTDLWLPFEDISKYHAFFTVEGGAAIALTDAGSTNGTFVKGSRLAPRAAKPLADGDVVGFGRHTFVFATAQGFAKLLAQLARASGRISSGGPG